MSRAPEVFDDLLGAVDRLLAVPPEDGDQGDPKYLDVIGDLLGYLARRMTELHGSRMAEETRFLEWLEEQMGCAVDELSGKTYVRDYYRQPEGVEKLLEVIEANHRTTTSLDVSKPSGYGAENPARRRIEEGYARSLAVIEPMLTELELTDRLIDELVYRLYGLSEDQIRTVQELLPHHDNG